MSLFGTGRREGILAVLLLFALAVLQHAPGVMLGQPRGPIDPGDLAAGRTTSVALDTEAASNQTVLLPAMQQAGAVVRAGSQPTWNPYSRFGEPFAATGAPVLYPPFWPLMLEDGDRWLDLVMLLHTALACVLAYRMLRALSVSRYVAFLCGGAYGLGWFLTTALDRLPEAAAAAWLPWIITTTWRLAFARRRVGHAAALALAVAIPFITGGFATATCGVALALACVVTWMLAIERDERAPMALATSAAAALALLLTAPLWMNALELGSAMASSTHQYTPRLQTAGLAGLLLPGLFGELAADAPRVMAQANPEADGMELALYPGALALVVAVMGLLRPKRTRMALFWLIVAGVALVSAIDGPIAELLRWAVPFDHSRPGALLAVFHLATVILVALGIENFFDAPWARRFAVPAAAGVVGSLAAVTLIIALVQPAWFGPALRALLGTVDDAELARAVEHVAATAIVPASAALLVALAFLAWRRLGILRFKFVLATVALGELCLLALLQVPRVDRAVDPTLAEMLPADGTRVVRIGEPDLAPSGWIAGRDGIRAVDAQGDQILDRTARYLESIEPGVVRVRARTRVGPFDRPFVLEDPMLARAGITAALASRSPAIGTFVPLAAAPGAVGAVEHRVMPYVAPIPTPRLRIAYTVEVVDDRAAALTAVRTAPPETSVIESRTAETRCARPASPAQLDILVDRPDHLAVRADMRDGRGYLLLLDAFAPGWVATIDGQPTDILPADAAFRAVQLREGQHEVVFDYRPLAARLGLPLAAAGAVLALGLLLLRRY